MTAQEIMIELQSLGDENTKRIWLKHGIKEPFFGVKIQDLKPIEKKIKKDYQLAKNLFATGNADAMYLAGLIADDEKMTREDLQTWVKAAVSSNISDFAVPWVACGGQYGYELALVWINSDVDYIAQAGWATLAGWVAVKPDAELDIPAYSSLLKRVEQNIHKVSDGVRKKMNGFIISVGAYVAALTDEANATAKAIGVVTVDANGTACKVPDAIEYILKAKARGSMEKKKKTLKC
ncbi:DNA alkylation repair protein [soil metagenome]|jgi:3-methyladenine DNA glycosylase AlkD